MVALLPKNCCCCCCCCCGCCCFGGLAAHTHPNLFQPSHVMFVDLGAMWYCQATFCRRKKKPNHGTVLRFVPERDALEPTPRPLVCRGRNIHRQVPESDQRRHSCFPDTVPAPIHHAPFFSFPFFSQAGHDRSPGNPFRLAGCVRDFTSGRFPRISQPCATRHAPCALLCLAHMPV